jgi:ankyrin repeat protein
MTYRRISLEVLGAAPVDTRSMQKQFVPIDHSVAVRGSDPGLSPLLACLHEWDLEGLDALLAGMPRLDIFEAAAVGRAERVLELVASDPALADAWCANGFTPLHFACFYGHQPVVRSLLACGAQPSARARNESGATPLHHAVSTGQRDIAELLLQRGAEVDLCDHRGYTPLHLAAANVYLEIVETLLQFGAAPLRQNAGRQTPGDLAQESGHLRIAECLNRFSVTQ